MRSSALLLATVFACVFACVASPPPEVPPVTSARVAPLPDAVDLATSLANEVGPRLAGSPGDAAAVAWGLKTMTSLGFAHVHSEPVTVPVWRRLEEAATLGNAPLAVTALGGSPSTPADGVSAEVTKVRSLDEVTSAAAGAFRDRIVFFDVTTPRARDGSGYGGGAKVRVLGPAAAAAKGALAVLVRSAGTDDGDLAHTGVTKDPDAPTIAIPSAALGRASADRLVAALVEDAKTKVRLRIRTERAADGISANVVGDVAGTEPGIVLLGAHLDSWDLGRGATDDGCGVGAVLDAAARIARAGTPRRTVRVVLFAAEENSGAGAKAYAAAHASDLHVSATEMDAGCGAPYEVRVLAGASESTTVITSAIARAVAPVPLADATAEGGADVQALRLLGVPVIDVRQDMTRYFDLHHTKGDDASAIDGPALRLAAGALYRVAVTVARADGTLAPVPEAKRKRSY